MASLGMALMTLAGPARGQDAGLEERIAILEAREAIRELIFAYGDSLDRRDFVAFSELFHRDRGTWVGGFGQATGRDAIFALMDEYLGHAGEPIEPTSHHVFSNIRISVEADRAEATTKWTFVVPAADGGPEWVYLGHYQDQFIREGQRWYFLRREAFTDIPIQ